MLRADLHCHTINSPDSCNHLPWVIDRCRKTGINCLAVTDHNDVDGAFELKKTAPFSVIIGEEVDTGEGEIIGLFIGKWIEPMQGLEKTIEEIKSQGGLVYLPHPLSVCRDDSLDVGKIKGLVQEIDIVEMFNSRTRHESRDNGWLAEWVLKGRVAQSAGSDAHAPHELGNVLIDMEGFASKADFLNSLVRARFSVKKTSPFLRAVMNHRVRKIIRHCC